MRVRARRFNEMGPANLGLSAHCQWKVFLNYFDIIDAHGWWVVGCRLINLNGMPERKASRVSRYRAIGPLSHGAPNFMEAIMSKVVV